MLAEFGRAFADADVVVLTDVYAAGEDPLPGVSGESIFDEIKKSGHASVRYVADKGALAAALATEVQKGDLVITLGAGDIYKSGEQLLEILEASRG